MSQTNALKCIIYANSSPDYTVSVLKTKYKHFHVQWVCLTLNRNIYEPSTHNKDYKTSAELHEKLTQCFSLEHKYNGEYVKKDIKLTELWSLCQNVPCY